MHFGKGNPQKVYYIDENGKKLTLKTTDVERDLEIMITNDGKCAAQVVAAVNSELGNWQNKSYVLSQ